MDELNRSVEVFTDWLKGRAEEIYSIVAIQKVALDEDSWEEAIGREFSITWGVHAERGHGIIEKIHKALLWLSKEYKFSLHDCMGTRSISGTHAVFKFTEDSIWRDVVKSIQLVRKKFGSQLYSTHLNIMRLLDGISADDIGEEAFDFDKPAGWSVEEISDKYESVKLTDADCEKILSGIGDRAGRLIIQALYTLYDAVNEPRYRRAVEGLVPAAELLKKHGLAGSHYFDFLSTQEIQSLLVSQAVSLMDVTRQRLECIPVTRESAKVAFEVPPPGLRVLYEACEYVIRYIVDLVGSMDLHEVYFAQDAVGRSDIPSYPVYSCPYVIATTSDSLEYDLLKVLFPEHRLNDPSAYSALTHEALHSCCANQLKFIFDVLNKDELISFEEGDFGKKSDKRFLEEVVVEVLDLIISFEKDIDHYMRDEWAFLVAHFIDGMKNPHGDFDTSPYILRTFFVKLWHDVCVSKDGSLQDLLYDNTKMRAKIREHLGLVTALINEFTTTHLLTKTSCAVSEIHQKRDYFSDILVNSIENKAEEYRREVVKFAGAFEALFPFLERMKDELRKKFEMMEIDRALVKQQAEKVFVGQILGDKCAQPHLLIHYVNRLVRDEEQLNYFEYILDAVYTGKYGEAARASEQEYGSPPPKNDLIAKLNSREDNSWKQIGERTRTVSKALLASLWVSLQHS